MTIEAAPQLSAETPDRASEGVALAVVGLTHRYPTAEGVLTVLRDFELQLGAGSYLAIMGASGAGKSTLLSVLGGLELPQMGVVTVGSHSLGLLSGDELAAYRRSTVGFVFQHYGLLETLTALENVELACTLAGWRRRLRRARARELLEAVGVGHRGDHHPLHLSGGERQRVAIARALANDPRLVLADEPTGNLDEDSAERVMDLLATISNERKCTLVVVTHSRSVAAQAERVIHLVAPSATDRALP